MIHSSLVIAAGRTADVKAINDIKKFSAAERKHWLEIKGNATNASKKRECAPVGSKANKKKRAGGGD
jgi:hypothetical protein